MVERHTVFKHLPEPGRMEMVTGFETLEGAGSTPAGPDFFALVCIW